MEPAEQAQPPVAAAQQLDSTTADEQPAAASGSHQQERQRAFALLQPICSMLLLQRAEPQRMVELLTGEPGRQRWAAVGCQSSCGCARHEVLRMALRGAALLSDATTLRAMGCRAASWEPVCYPYLAYKPGRQAAPHTLLAPCAALEAAVQEVPQAGLQQCMDYVLFPLVMMLDVAAALRQTTRPGGGKSSEQAGSAAAATAEGEAGALMALPAMSPDRAVEAALGCVRVLLHRCSFQSGQGLLGLLRRLAAMLALPAGAASEEMREQVRVVRTAGCLGLDRWRGQATTSVTHVTCAHPVAAFMCCAVQALLCVEAAAAGVLRTEAPPTVRAALLGEEAAPLLGYLSSLLLQVSKDCCKLCPALLLGRCWARGGSCPMHQRFANAQ